MSPQEMDALVERIGDEILARVGGPKAPSAAASAWPRPQRGYASVIEAMALGSGVTAGSLDATCAAASALGLRAVWTASSWTPRAYRLLTGGSVRIGAAVGFPHGDATPAAKRADAETALMAGAEELLTTLNAGAWLSGERDRAWVDLLAVCELARSAGAPVTAALDAASLDGPQLVRAAIAARLAGASAIQLSGWPAGGSPRPEQVRLLADAVGEDLIVGAAGSVTTFATAAAYAAAGAARVAACDAAAVLAGAPPQPGG